MFHKINPIVYLMKIKLLVVGKTSDNFLASLISNYIKRINYYVKFELIELNNLKIKKVSHNEIKKKVEEEQTQVVNSKEIVNEPSLENVSMENAAYLQDMEDLSPFELDSIELSTPELFSSTTEENSFNQDINSEKNPEIFDKESILSRMSEIAQLQQANSQLQQQVKELRGDLQTAQRESVQDKKRVAVEKFKRDLTEVRADAKADKKVQTNKFADTVKFELEKLKPIMENMQQGIGSAPEDSETS